MTRHLPGLLVALIACEGSPSHDAASAPERPTATATARPAAPTTTATTSTAPSSQPRNEPAKPSAEARLVAVGDLHGDLKATREVLRLAGLIDESDHWTGGDTTLVQLGDILDRGDEEVEIFDLLERLAVEAKEAGGAVHLVNGNHELMNVAGRFLYVTPDGFRDFARYDDGAAALKAYPKLRRGRRAAFTPGASFAQRLARYPVVLRLGDTLFVHGGLLPKHVAYGIDRINARAKAFLLGEDDRFWGWLADWDSPINMRHYTDKPGKGDCYLLEQVLKKTGAKRMVMGHTPQLGGITGYCDGQAWGVDACMSRHCGVAREALELRGDRILVLK